jgi:hypothetical protein
MKYLQIKLHQFFLLCLQFIFGFNTWHALSPISARPYRIKVAEIASSINPVSVVEVGCGLGAIVDLIDAPVRVGYDIENNVIRAANFINLFKAKKASFKHGGFDCVNEKSIDILIAVNLLHDHSEGDIDRWLTPILPKLRYLLVDKINLDHELNYKHYHDYNFLNGRMKLVQEFNDIHDQRTFCLYQRT